jgi:hypothetical protein
MKAKKKTPKKSDFDSKSLTRSARRKLIQAIDELISNFGGKPLTARARLIDSRQSKDLEKSYKRLRNTAIILNHWHSNSEYLKGDGACSALTRTGKHSLQSLAVDALSNAEEAARAVDDLIEFRLVRRSSEKYIPNKRSAVVGQRSPLILSHATTAIARMIETITHNVSGNRPARYERQVSEVRISEKELPQFLRFTEEQGQYLIDSIDDWLSTRELPKTSSEKFVTVGVGAYAWAEQEKNPKKRKRASSTRPRQ